MRLSVCLSRTIAFFMACGTFAVFDVCLQSVLLSAVTFIIIAASPNYAVAQFSRALAVKPQRCSHHD